MKITATGQADDHFMEALRKGLKKEATTVDQVGEKQLEERRDDLDQSPAEVSPEQYLDSDLSNRTDTEKDSDDSEKGLIEKRLRDQPQAAAANNQDMTGITQARLEKASKETYPHRNPDAWERTGEKRPVNNLEEEMGEASDEKRLERLEKAEKKAQDQPERVVDKDVGKQRELKPVKAFNLKERKNAGKYAGLEDYLAYKSGSGKVWSGRLAKVKKIDEKLAGLMGKIISDDDKKTILGLKGEKATLLRLAISEGVDINNLWDADTAWELEEKAERAGDYELAERYEARGFFLDYSTTDPRAKKSQRWIADKARDMGITPEEVERRMAEARAEEEETGTTLVSKPTSNPKQAKIIKEAMPEGSGQWSSDMPPEASQGPPMGAMSEPKEWPSPERIAQDFQVDESAAAEVLQYAQEAEGAGSDEVTVALSRANELLGGFGIEAHKDPKLLDDFSNEFGDAAALYINTGSMDLPTLLYDTEKQEFIFTALSDWREAWEQGREKESLESPEYEGNDDPWGEEEEYSGY